MDDPSPIIELACKSCYTTWAVEVGKLLPGTTFCAWTCRCGARNGLDFVVVIDTPACLN